MTRVNNGRRAKPASAAARLPLDAWREAFVLVALIAAASACGGGGTTQTCVPPDFGSSATGDTSGDGALGDAPQFDFVPAEASGGDTAWFPSDVAPGALGAGCSADDDCVAGLLCITFVGEGTCTRACTETCDLPGWTCKGAPGQSGTVLSVCHPPGSNLCTPCSADAQCGAGYCLTFSDGLRCTRPCDEARPCPNGYECRDTLPAGRPEAPPTRQCQPVSGACDCGPAQADEVRPCERANEHGRCLGLEQCDPAAGWLPCTATEPRAELCDGLDNDCDGLADEELVPPAEPCQQQNAFGTCPGTWQCQGSAGHVCLAAEPAEDRCDGRDNDCDGATDEDFRATPDGPYVAFEHCGQCGQSCAQFVPFATETTCAVPQDGPPHCAVVACEPGYFRPPNLDICVPVGDVSDCTPCNNDNQCLGLPGVCLTLNDGGVCVRECTTDPDCPEALRCVAGHCLPASGSCTCNEANAGDVRPCTQANEFGICVGEEACDAATGWSPCSAAAPEPEACDGYDNDCDGETDELGAAGCTPYYRDGDGDQFGGSGSVLCLCAPGLGHETATGGDCDDADADVHPEAVERCNGHDDNCTGGIDEDDASGCTMRYRDTDGDGFGLAGDERCLCTPVEPYLAELAGDCADQNPDVNPGALEVCNGIDDNCSDTSDEPGATGCAAFFADADGDGFGDGNDAACLCTPDLAHPLSVGGDCDDLDPLANPDGVETCGGGDEDCDANTDEPDAAGCRLFWPDRDDDGYGVPNAAACLCAASGDYRATAGGDCDDQDPEWQPGRPEACVADGDCCLAGAVCRYERCLAAPASCATSDDCQDDTGCVDGECLPFGLGPLAASDAACTVMIVPDALLPDVQCAWTAPPAGDAYPDHVQVLGAPSVIDLDLDADPATRRPSLVFVAYNGTGPDMGPDPGDGSGSNPDQFFGIIRIVDGASCALQATLDAVKVVGASSPAAGDLDGDGRPEIVALAVGGGLVAYGRPAGAPDFSPLWESHTVGGAPSQPAAGVLRWGGPTLTDLDGDGRAEALLGAMVYDQTGALITSNLGLKDVGRGRFPVVSDVDHDSQPELVSGDGVWRYDWAASRQWVRESWSSSVTDGLVAFADFGEYAVGGLPTGLPEVVVVSSGNVRVQRISGAALFGNYALPYTAPATGPGPGGQPTAGDLDGDGRPEVLVAGFGGLAAFDFDCAGSPPPFDCQASGILWSLPILDTSSGQSGAALFDFQADGLVEALHADECYLRIVRGTDGHVLFSHGRSSATFLDAPVVADVDGDHRAEFVVIENALQTSVTCPESDPIFQGLHCERASDCPGGPCVLGFCRCVDEADCGAAGDYACAPPLPNTPGTDPVCLARAAERRAGVTVWRDRRDTWAETRPVFHQQAYFVTNVTDSGVIPTFGESSRNWQTAGLNTFRRNRQQPVAPAPLSDLTIQPGVVPNCDAEGVVALPVAVCNRGAGSSATAVNVAFYRGDPQQGQVLCALTTDGPVAAGTCADLVCAFAPPAGTAGLDVTVVADFGLGEQECREANSTATFRHLTCLNLP